MVSPDFKRKEELLRFLKCSEDDISKLFRKAESIISYVDSQIGGKDYWQVSYSELSWLYSLVCLMSAKKVAETGVGPGSTSFAILSVLKLDNGKLYSFDKGERYGEAEPKPVGFLVPEKLRKNWSLVLGDSKNTLKNVLEKNAPFDIFFHDSEHTYEHVTFELETALPYLNKRFAIVIDNYDWTEAPKDFSKKHNFLLLPMVDDMCFLLPRI
ncbi:MAG: class I SAM-dependent methyltransferase [Thermoplasmatales archaeon]|nr:class I SAM-dependent methyltransferase [Thermoplasmatales archaeon]MCW6169955.1 class I SAM-dependent methyltransferase [Thermoplasmatales archaeon]